MFKTGNGDGLVSISLGGGDKNPTPSKPIVDDNIRSEWNKFQDFLQRHKMAGHPDLDNKDTQLGRKFLDQYRKENPSTPLTYDYIPAIQNSLNQYRQNAWSQIQAGKATSDAKKLDEFMPNLSQTDGWLGSKTSQARFPLLIEKGKVIGFADNPDFQNRTPQFQPPNTKQQLPAPSK